MNNYQFTPLPPTRRDPRAFIYCRVSSKRQAEASISLPVQAKECQRFAEDLGFTVSGGKSNVGLRGVWHDAAVSAYNVPIHQRPGFKAMWSEMRAGDQIVMIALDRGWRNVWDFASCYQEFKASDVEVHFVNSGMGFGGTTDSPMNRFLLTQEANLAQLKSELISARVKEWHRERKLKSLSTPGSPQACQSARQWGQTKSGRKVMPMEYLKSGPDWGAAYRGIKAAREDLPKKPGRIFGYCRVSTDDQDCRVQIQAVNREIPKIQQSYGGVTAAVFQDPGVSAYRTPWKDRPAGKQLWDQLQEGDHVVILAADRAFRSLCDMAVSMQELEAKGVVLHFIRDGINTGTKGGIRLLQSLALAAQWERDDMADRIRFSLEAKREDQGMWLGPQTARWIQEKIELNHRLLLVDPVDVDRTILITEMIRNKGKTSWQNLVREIENACAEFDGRKPIPFAGCSLQLFKRRCSAEERFKVQQYIKRKRHSWAMTSKRFGVNNGRQKNELLPEISISWARRWEEDVWQPLVNHVSVKPDIFTDGVREKILEVNA